MFGGDLVGGEVVCWWQLDWWRGGFLVATWLVAKLPCGEMTGKQHKVNTISMEIAQEGIDML